MQEKLLAYLKDNPTASLREMAKKFKCSHTNIDYYIKLMLISKQLEKIPVQSKWKVL